MGGHASIASQGHQHLLASYSEPAIAFDELQRLGVFGGTHHNPYSDQRREAWASAASAQLAFSAETIRRRSCGNFGGEIDPAKGHFRPLAIPALAGSAPIKEARRPSPLSRLPMTFGKLTTNNQALLVLGFNNARSPDAPLIVLDGHSVIDTPSGPVRIESRVFAQLGITQFIFLADNPQAIGLRREKDQSRTHSQRSPEELDDHQTQALRNAFTVARHLDAPLIVFTISQVDGVRVALEAASPT
jgi:adenylate kinase